MGCNEKAESEVNFWRSLLKGNAGICVRGWELYMGLHEGGSGSLLVKAVGSKVTTRL